MSENLHVSSNHPVDAVVLWVDGNDAVLTEKRNNWLQKEGKTSSHSGALPTRFASKNEIRYCVLSILIFAPFVRNIFIVTDGQDPNLYEEVETYFPEKSGTLKIVDHKEIFRGFEQYLPNFNASSIHTLIWKIEGLSDNFIYFNDDMILIRETKQEDWVINNRPLLRGEWRFPPYKKLAGNYFKTLINKNLRNNPGYQPRISFYIRQWKAAYLLGWRIRYYYHCHTPHSLNRRSLEKFFSENMDLLEKNISYRFRDQDQFITSSLAYHLEIMDGNRQFAKLNLVYFHPYYSDNRLKRKIRRCENDSGIKSICVQSLDMISIDVQEKIFNFMDRTLNLPERG